MDAHYEIIALGFTPLKAWMLLKKSGGLREGEQRLLIVRCLPLITWDFKSLDFLYNLLSTDKIWNVVEKFLN